MILDTYRHWRDAFAEAIDPRFYSIDYLDGLVLTGRAFLWASDTAAIVAEVKTFPTGARVIHGLVAAGDLEGIKALIEQAEAWGKSQGCIAALIESRPGWARALKAEGYASFQTSIMKEL